jgi:hypothetical protein
VSLIILYVFFHRLYLILDLLICTIDIFGLFDEILVFFGGPELAIATLGLDYRFELLLGSFYAELGSQVCQPLRMKTTEGINLKFELHIHLRDRLEELFLVHKGFEL